MQPTRYLCWLKTTENDVRELGWILMTDCDRWQELSPANKASTKAQKQRHAPATSRTTTPPTRELAEERVIVVDGSAVVAREHRVDQQSSHGVAGAWGV